MPNYRRYVILEENPNLLATLERLGVPYEIERKRYGDIESVTGELFVYEDDPAFAEKCAAIEAHHLLAQDGTWLSPQEEDAAAWHSLSLRASGYPRPETGWFTRMYGDDGPCRRCGFHGRAIAPVRLARAPSAKTPSIFGVHWAHEVVLVSAATKALFERERVSGVRYLAPVLHGSGASITGVWQLEIETVLAPAMQTDALTAERCEPITDPALLRALTAQGSWLARGPYCGRTKWNHPHRGLVTLDAGALASVPDIVMTHELLGSGGSSDRLVLVRKWVRDALRAAKIKGAAFRPLALA